MELVKIENNSKYGLVVSSRVIAKQLSKQHFHVIRDLENILTNPNLGALDNQLDTEDFLINNIVKSSYIDLKGESRKEYLLTKDGFTLYMFNIQGYNDFKMAYINKFNEMENFIKTQTTQTQIQLPKAYKLIKKYYNGELVMTVEDLANIFGFNKTMMYYHIKKANIDGVLLFDDELVSFKRQNPMFNPIVSSLLVYDRDDVIDLTKFLNRIDKQNEVIKYFESDVKKTLPNSNVYIPTEIQLKQADLLLKLTENMDYDFKHFFRGYATYLVIGKEVYSQYEFAKKIKGFKSELQVINKNELGEFIGQVKNDIEYKKLPIKAKKYMDKIYDEVLS